MTKKGVIDTVYTMIYRENNTSSYQIRAYGAGHVQINDQRIMQSVIVSPDKLITGWPPQQLDELEAQHLEILLSLKPEVVLLGTGPRYQVVPAKILAPLINQHIGIECMDTGAACRTYTALSSDERRVTAALLIQ